MDKKLHHLVSLLGKEFKKRKLTLVTAESCTGGALSYYISLNPESSAILERGFVSYSIHSKEKLLKVSPYILQVKGVVSKEAAMGMAKGALENSVAQVAIATTGVVGADKSKRAGKNEAGIVWISCTSITGKTLVQKNLVQGNREVFCHKIIFLSLKMLLKYVKKFP